MKASLAIEQVLSRSVPDSAALPDATQDATQGADPGAPFAALLPARPYWVEAATAPGRLRIAFGRKPLFGRQVHAACIAALEDGARRLELPGHQLEEAAPPVDREACAMAFITVLAGGVRAEIQVVARLACSSPAGWAATPSCSAWPASWRWRGLRATLNKSLAARSALFWAVCGLANPRHSGLWLWFAPCSPSQTGAPAHARTWSALP